MNPRSIVNGFFGRIFLSHTFIFFLFVVVISIVGFQYFEKIILESTANELRVLSVGISQTMQRHFRRIESNFFSFEDSVFFGRHLATSNVTPADKEVIEGFLRDHLVANPYIDQMAIFNKEGLGVVATDPKWLQINVEGEDFFTKGIKDFNFPDIYSSQTLGKHLVVSGPVGYQRKVYGVVVASIKLKTIYEILEQKHGFSDDVSTFLLDGDLKFIATGQSENDLDLKESHLLSTTLRLHLNDEFWVGSYQNMDDEEVLGTAYKIPNYNWYIVIERLTEAVFSKADVLKKTILFFALFVCLCYGLISWFISHLLTSPISKLATVARTIGAGELTSPVPQVSSVEELRTLSTEMDRMRHQLFLFQGNLKERLATSERLRIQNERLASVGRLASVLAHEIRNPLNAMSLLLARLKQKLSAKKEEEPELFDNLFREISRLDRLVSQILDYAKPIELKKTKISLNALLERVLTFCQPVLQAKGLTYRLDLDGELTMLGEEDPLRQSFLNIIQNAIEAGGNLLVKGRMERTCCIVEFEDDGCGVDVESQEKLFELFFTTKPEGTGIGLSMVHKIITAHGGSIEMVSQKTPPSGTTVRLVFPIITSA